MTSKTLDIDTLFAPPTCFAIVCLAFSLVAISTAWSNIHSSNGVARKDQGLPHVHENNAHKGTATLDTLVASTPGVNQRQWEEPPPEYSPPAKNASLALAEKSKTHIATPDVEERGIRKAHDAVYTAVVEHDCKALADLLATGADHSARIGDLQRTPLHQAAHLNHRKCILLLLRNGASASTADAKGDTAMHLAAWAGNVEALATLLELGADVDWISGRNGYSPLWCAVSAYQIDAARLLLRHGARVNLRSISGGSQTLLHQAAVTGQGAMCELLLERGARPDCVDDDKSTPLHYAAAAGAMASVRALICGGADLEARSADGMTAVHWTAHKGHADVLGLLLDHGARIECRTETGATSLHLAANRGHITVARLLLERGASCRPGLADWGGIVGTPSEIAISRGHIKLARTLKAESH